MRALLFALVLAAAPPSSAAARLKVAAIGLTAVGTDAAFVGFLNERLAQSLREGGLDVITPRDIQAMLGLERQKALLGCDAASGSCMAELANALGADLIALGDVAQLEKRSLVGVKLLSAQTGMLVGAVFRYAEGREEMVNAVAAAGQALSKAARGGAAAAPVGAGDPVSAGTPPAESPSDRGCDGAWCAVDSCARRTAEDAGFDLNAVAASSPSNAWAVGYGATVLRWDGQRWSQKNAPTTLGGILRAVWTAGPDQTVVAGQNGVAFRWKGTGWATLSIPYGPAFYELSGLPDGGSVRAATDEGLLQLDGSRWVSTWDGGSAGSVHSVSASEAWAVARGGRVLHLEGGAWRELKDTPDAGQLSHVFATGPDDVWFAGESGLVVEHRPSAKGAGRWVVRRAGEASALGVWGTGADNVWIAGTDGSLQHFDGQDFVALPLPCGGTVFGLAGSGTQDLWVVQDDCRGPRPGGVVHHLRR